MTRRELLKTMAASMGAMLVSGSGVASLISCSKNKKRLIFYFTATGNSLYVARSLSQDLVSIPQAMKAQLFDYEADEIGLVYPVYLHTPPAMVFEFLEKAHLKANYFFAVPTYGKRKCNAAEIIDTVGKRYGINFNYIRPILMVDNFLPGFDMNEEIKLDKHVEENLAVIQADLEKQLNYHDPVTQEERDQHNARLQDPNAEPGPVTLDSSHAYTVDESKCVQCGNCVQVCPRGNWKLTETKAVNSGTCDLCMSCIHNCAHFAITLLMGHEVNPNARYRNEHISLNDLKRSNSQV